MPWAKLKMKGYDKLVGVICIAKKRIYLHVGLHFIVFRNRRQVTYRSIQKRETKKHARAFLPLFLPSRLMRAIVLDKKLKYNSRKQTRAANERCDAEDSAGTEGCESWKFVGRSWVCHKAAGANGEMRSCLSYRIYSLALIRLRDTRTWADWQRRLFKPHKRKMRASLAACLQLSSQLFNLHLIGIATKRLWKSQTKRKTMHPYNGIICLNAFIELLLAIASSAIFSEGGLWTDAKQAKDYSVVKVDLWSGMAAIRAVTTSWSNRRWSERLLIAW